MQNKLMSRTVLAASVLLIALQTGLTANNSGMSQVHAEKPVVSFGGGQPEIQSPYVQPAWSAKIDAWEVYSNSNFTVTGEGKVFSLSGKRLIALNAQTGKSVWTYGANLLPIIVYQEGTIFGAANDGSIYALSASNGKRKWLSSVKLPSPDAIEIVGDTLYVLKGKDMYAINPKTGKQLWKNTELQSDNGHAGLIDAGDVVFRTFTVQGALTSVQLNAIDKKTGKKLWGMFRQGAPLKIEGGLVYSVKDNYSPIVEGTERSVTVSVINLKTGELKGSRVYRWSVQEGPGVEYQTGGPCYLDGNDFYVHQNGIIARYDFTNYKPDGKPMRTYYEPSNSYGYPAQKVHRGRILFAGSGTGALAGIKTANGQHVSWAGDNPSSMTDIYGKGVYLAQTDGIMHAIDFDSGKPLFRVKTGARHYGPTLKEGGSLIIQTNGKLTGVLLPAALK
jgi:outer membrane protein assembly factor BamB